jgi:hypothetical protein
MSQRTDPAASLHLTAERMTCSAVATAAAHLDGLPLVLTYRAFRDLERELGSVDAVWLWLRDLASSHDCLVAANVPTSSTTSTTAIISPPTWSQARQAATATAAQPLLERAFGHGTPRRPVDERG